jgi:hypothetical protein
MSDIGQLDRNKDRFLEYIKYFKEEIAEDSKLINHTDENRHFVRYTMSEVFSAKHDQLLSPFIGLETPSIKIKNDNGQNIQAVWRGAIIIGHGYEKGNFTDRDKALDQCYYIFLKILAKINHQRVPRVRNGKHHHRIVKFDFDSLQANPIFDFFGGDRAGLRWEFELNSQFDLGYYESDWRNVDDPTPQPPLAIVTDGAETIELFQGDDYTCKVQTCADGTLILKNSEGTTVATYTIPSGDTTTETAPDGDMRINGADIGAAGKVPSGGEKNLRVVNSADGEHGTLNANGNIEFPDSTVANNQGTWQQDFPSAGYLQLPFGKVKNKEGNDVQVDYKPAADGYIFEETACPAGGGTISVALSDNAPNVGDTITITATATGFTPDSYLYFGYDGSGNIVFIAEQASNTFDWTVGGVTSGSWFVYVLGVENGSPDVTAFGTQEITVASNLLLDTDYGTGANFAFAFFKLRGDYTGPIALIRRSGDNAQKAFYFDSNGVLSMSSEDGSGTSLASWAGNGAFYLVTGYSQDVAGVTFTASSAAEQQQLGDGGVLYDINGAVAIVGNNDRYTISTSLSVKSAFIVAKNDGYNLVNFPFSGIGQGMSWGGGATTGIGMGDGTNPAIHSTVEDLNPHLASILTDTGVYVDGNLEASGVLNPLTITTVGGRPELATLGMNGKTSVIVSYATDKTSDRAAIEANINDNFATSLLP